MFQKEYIRIESSTQHSSVNKFVVINIPEEDVEPKQIILDPDDQPMWENAKIVAPASNSSIIQLNVDDNFVINSTHLNMIWENKFDGFLRADPHDHIHEFLTICDMFKYGETQKLNNHVRNDLEDFKRRIRSMRTVHWKLYDSNDRKTTSVLPNKESKIVNQEPQSKTDFEKIMTKFLDDQRVSNMFVKNNVNDMILKMKQNEKNFQTKIKNMERKIDEWSKSQNVSSEQTDRTDPPPPQAHTEHVNAVFTGSEKSNDSRKIQKDPPPPIINIGIGIKLYEWVGNLVAPELVLDHHLLNRSEEAEHSQANAAGECDRSHMKWTKPHVPSSSEGCMRLEECVGKPRTNTGFAVSSSDSQVGISHRSRPGSATCSHGHLIDWPQSKLTELANQLQELPTKLLNNLVVPWELQFYSIDDLYRSLQGRESYQDHLRSAQARARRASEDNIGVVKERGVPRSNPFKDWASPKTPTEIHQFLGLAGITGDSLKGFQKIATMTKLTQKKVKFEWGDKQEAAFQLLKQKLCSAPILALPEGIITFGLFEICV
ncbi:hypothetical protein Tco_0178514 [Tanacetum coccineum]